MSFEWQVLPDGTLPSPPQDKETLKINTRYLLPVLLLFAALVLNRSHAEAIPQCEELFPYPYKSYSLLGPQSDPLLVNLNKLGCEAKMESVEPNTPVVINNSLVEIGEEYILADAGSFALATLTRDENNSYFLWDYLTTKLVVLNSDGTVNEEGVSFALDVMKLPGSEIHDDMVTAPPLAGNEKDGWVTFQFPVIPVVADNETGPILISPTGNFPTASLMTEIKFEIADLDAMESIYTVSSGNRIVMDSSGKTMKIGANSEISPRSAADYLNTIVTGGLTLISKEGLIYTFELPDDFFTGPALQLSQHGE